MVSGAIVIRIVIGTVRVGVVITVTGARIGTARSGIVVALAVSARARR